MARMHHWVVLPFLGLALTGCVSAEKYNALKLDRDQLTERVNQSDTALQSARTENDMLKQQIAGLSNANGGRDGMIGNLMQQNADLTRQVAEMSAKYDSIGKLGGSILPAPLTSELTAFAKQNPELVDFDSARGIVKFKSDVTFATGSAEVTPRAREVIARFATILNSPSAHGYELMVAGHTDNTRVVNPETIRNGHKDNWYLSCHRAIAVSNVLQSDRVAMNRLSVIGYADQRPIASNSTDSGRAQNRRVEVLILPTTVHAPTVASSIAPTRPMMSTKRAPMLNKDADVPSASPSLNK